MIAITNNLDLDDMYKLIAETNPTIDVNPSVFGLSNIDVGRKKIPVPRPAQPNGEGGQPLTPTSSIPNE